jgi:4-amino-4-deoxy-L-arabinose transferase-like glycosyltransferase
MPPARWPAIILFILAGVVLLVSALARPLERTQEARVLETAREMLDGPAEYWLVPRLNGDIRVQKPPLAYWLAAGGFKILGTSTPAGRLPFVLLTLATAYLVYRTGRSWFGELAGFAAGAMMVSSVLYAYYGHVAETDALATLFVTGGCVAVCHLADAPDSRRRVAMSCLCGVCIGLAALGKGPPAALVVVFLATVSIAERNWRIPRDFALLGGLPLALLVGAPWWLMVNHDPALRQVLEVELTKLRQGATHAGGFWIAWAFGLKAMLPWAFAAVGALVWVWDRNSRPWKRLPVRRCLLWAATVMWCIMLPQQMQEHYFLPLVPPLMLLAGAFLECGWRADGEPLGKLVQFGMLLTAGAGLLASPAMIVAGRIVRGSFAGSDLAVASGLAALFAGVLVSYRLRARAAVGITLLAGCVAMPLVLNLWVPRLKPVFHADMAADIGTGFGNRPLLFYPAANIPLVFELRRTVPVCETPEELSAALGREPGAVVIIEQNKPPTPVPEGLHQLRFYPYRGRGVYVYEQPVRATP